MVPIKRMYLTKSRYTKGRDCEKRLWSLVHTPPNYDDEPLGGAAAIGVRVGELARKFFQAGVLVDAKPWEHDKAVSQTRSLMADSSISAIFEAAFDHEGVRIRCDILERRAGGKWTLREVKASKSVKPEHLYDVALQIHVLQGAGVKLDRYGVQHLNGEYQRGKGAVDLNELFKFTDLTDTTEMPLSEVRAEIPVFQRVLRKRKAPDIEAGLHCPGDCEFLDTCTVGMPDDWVRYLPKLGKKRFDELKAMGIHSVVDIPDGFELTAIQEKMRLAHRSSKGFVSTDIKTHLRQFGPPAYYLDFETMMPAVPIYCGTSPYQQIPFQWSLHYVAKNASTKHWEYLAKGDVDPRRELAEKLVSVLAGKKAPVISYSPYEKTMLNLLKSACPDLSNQLDDIVDRLQDLLPVVRGHTYFPGYMFSNSIKSVAPSLVPGFSYDDLKEEGIADGMGASEVFERIARGGLSPEESEDRLRSALLAYCKRDTEAMVVVHEALNGLPMS